MAIEVATKLEYKVVMDRSMTSNNKPEAIEKVINEMVSQGWRLAHVTSHGNNNVSTVCCIFERDKAST